MAKLTPLTPAQAADAAWRDVFKIETTTPALGGVPAFDLNDDPTTGYSNAQAVMLQNNMEIVRHRNPATERNAILSSKVDGATGLADYLGMSGGDVVVEGASTPLVLSFAKGFGQNGAVDYIGYIDADESVDTASILAVDGQYPIYAIYNTSTAAVTFGFGTDTDDTFEVANVQPSTTPNVPNRYWWNPTTKKVRRTEGSPGSVAWADVCAVCIGFAFVSGNALDTVVCRGIGPSADDGVNTIPAGAVSAYASSATPAGWLQCDGTAISRAAYAKLFAAIGTTFGVGNGTTTFNLPDLRGEFIRAWDDGRGVDAARAFGSTQADEFEAHTHDVLYHSGGSSSAGTYLSSNTATNATYTTSSTGGTETRPRNVALNYIIKF